MGRRQPERWSLEVEGRLHEVFVQKKWPCVYTWHVDGEQVAQEHDFDDKVVLVPLGPDPDDLTRYGRSAASAEGASTLGAVGVRGPKGFVGTRRVVLHRPDPEAEEKLHGSFEVGTVDLVPDPGTRGARRLESIRRHPRWHVVKETFAAGGLAVWAIIFAGVIMPVLRLFVPDWEINGPDIDLPSVNLPSIPFPDLPSIPFPDLPDWLGDVMKVLLALGLAWVVACGEAGRASDPDADQRRWRPGAGPAPSPTSETPPEDDETETIHDR